MSGEPAYQGANYLRREVIGDATLFLGDCQEILPSFGGVNHVITDAPYEDEAHAAGRRILSQARAIEEAPLPFAAITPDLRQFIAEWSALRSAGWFLGFCQAEAVSDWREALEAAGAAWRRAMVWIKPDGSPQLSGDRPAQGYESIVAAWCGVGRSVWFGGGKRGVFTFGKHDPGVGHGGAGNEHPTQKPIALMAELVDLFTRRQQLICDPFMGSGSTAVAALKHGRRFIGVELDPDYFELACRRAHEAWRQPRLFDEPQPAPTQEKLGL